MILADALLADKDKVRVGVFGGGEVSNSGAVRHEDYPYLHPTSKHGVCCCSGQYTAS